MSPFTSIKSSSLGTVVISFVFSSTQISPNVSRFFSYKCTDHMICLMLVVSTPTNCFSVYCNRSTAVSFDRYPIYQAWRKFRRVQFLKYSSECITVRYSIRKFKKFRQIFLTTFAKRLHIGKIFPSADDRTQAYDYDYPPAYAGYFRIWFFSALGYFWFLLLVLLYSYLYYTTSFKKSKCCCPVFNWKALDINFKSCYNIIRCVGYA